jgi:hypothetical protein
MGLISITDETDGTSADANDLNSRFATITGLVNGNIDSANIANGGVSTPNLATGAVTAVKIANEGVTYTQAAEGFCVQEEGYMDSAVATGTTVLPFDDTIPQNTEGVQFMSQVITPKSATNTLEIEAQLSVAHTASAGYLSIALFQDSTANALAAATRWYDVANSGDYRTIKFRMIAGTTSATTFKIRIGNSSAGTTTFNGASGARQFGGVNASSLFIREYKEL